MLYFNPLDKFCKSRIGAISADTNLMFRIYCNAERCTIVFKSDKDNVEIRYMMSKNGNFFEQEIHLNVGLYWYYFETSDNRKIGMGENFDAVFSNNPNKYQLTVYSKDYLVPDWLKGGIIYQIFPDRFYKGDYSAKTPCDKVMHDNWDDCPIYAPNKLGKVVNNDFFGGNLTGIIEKLDYLVSLGVTAIYLNPIFEAFSNHRYDTGNYMKIDGLLGDEKILKELIIKAEEKGIKIILDGVFNHTGDDSIYFNKYGKYDSIGAFQDPNSKYKSWFKFIKYPSLYESWWGITTLPALDKTSKEYIDYISGANGVIEHYTKLGIGGWRLDVVDELPANFVRELRKAVKRTNPNAIVIGEVWEDASNKISYGVRREYFQGKELDSVMNYPLKNAIIHYVENANVKELSYVVKEQLDHYPKQVLDSLMNVLATHDTYRLLSAVGEVKVYGKSKEEQEKIVMQGEVYERAKQNLKIASVLQYTLCGVPSVYYGDEIGMQGYSDPLNRRTFKWDKQDLDLKNFFVKLGEIRKSYSAFVDGDFEEVYADNGAYIFKRCSKDSQLLIVVNKGNEFKILFDNSLTDLISEKTYQEEFIVKENSFAILVNK